MFSFNKTTFLAAAIAVAMPLAASAATVDIDIAANAIETDTGVLEVGQSLVFKYTAIEALDILGISLAATSDTVANIVQVTFDYAATTGDTFSFTQNFGSVAAGLDSILGANLPNPFAIGDMLSVSFLSNGIDQDVGITATISTGDASDNVPPVPVPAAGLLLGSALLAGGAVARRKKKQA